MRENAGDLDAARARVAVVARAEEGVRLQRELAAELVLVVHDERLHAEEPELDRGVDARRAAADDEDVGLDRRNLPERRQRVVGRKRGQPLAAPDLHPGPDRRHASLDGKAVDEHGALAALAVRAEDALGASVARMVAEHLHAVREERRRDDFSFVRLHLAAVEGEGNLRALARREESGGSARGTRPAEPVSFRLFARAIRFDSVIPRASTPRG